MDPSESDDRRPAAPAESATRLDRRKFLGAAAATAGGLLLGDLATSGDARAQPAGKFTEWGWPQPYEQISPKSKQWLESKGWWPLNAGWIVVWSGEEMIGNILQSEKLLEKRGIEVKWPFVAAGFSNEAFIPGRIQLASTGARRLRRSPTRCRRAPSPSTRRASRMRRPDRGFAAQGRTSGQKVLKRPAVVGTTTGSTTSASSRPPPTSIKDNQDFTLRSRSRRPRHRSEGSRCIHDLGAARLLLDGGAEDDKAPRDAQSVLHLQRLLLHAARDRGKRTGRCATDDRCVRRSGALGEGQSAEGARLADGARVWAAQGADPANVERYLFWPSRPSITRSMAQRPVAEGGVRGRQWAFSTGASKNKVTSADCGKRAQDGYKQRRVSKLGWKVPARPPSEGFRGAGNLPYKPYAAEIPPDRRRSPGGRPLKPWTFKGKTTRVSRRRPAVDRVLPHEPRIRQRPSAKRGNGCDPCGGVAARGAPPARRGRRCAGASGSLDGAAAAAGVASSAVAGPALLAACRVHHRLAMHQRLRRALQSAARRDAAAADGGVLRRGRSHEPRRPADAHLRQLY